MWLRVKNSLSGSCGHSTEPSGCIKGRKFLNSRAITAYSSNAVSEFKIKFIWLSCIFNEKQGKLRKCLCSEIAYILQVAKDILQNNILVFGVHKNKNPRGYKQPREHV
jgi:hypothetical protein